MFCPKCATNNLDGASFCRGCGANISLVPQAMTGQVAPAPVEEVAETGRRRRHGKEVTLEQCFKNIFMGVAFLIVAIALSRTIGGGWWFWMLLPAFSMMGTGIAQYIRVKERDKRAPQLSPPATRAFPARQPNDLMPPVPSVTEGTTRHLGVEPPTRHLDAKESK